LVSDQIFILEKVILSKSFFVIAVIVFFMDFVLYFFKSVAKYIKLFTERKKQRFLLSGQIYVNPDFSHQ